MTRAGRIDVHSHLLPGIDDGCATLADSLACARRMVAAGYARGFCTPHFWPSYPRNTLANVARWTADLQAELDRHGIALQLSPGGEINLRPGLSDDLPAAAVPTYGGRGTHCLVDIWADALPPHFATEVRWLQSLGLTVILAHPERMRAVQLEPELADYFVELGLLMQGNLQCLGEPLGTPNRITGERYLLEGRYFMLGSDLHNDRTLDVRLAGLGRAVELVGQVRVDRLTIDHPATLLG